MVDLFILLTGR